MHRRGIGVFFPNANSELTLLLPAHPTENPRFIQRPRSPRVTDNSRNWRDTGQGCPTRGSIQNVELNVRFFPFREVKRSRSICFSRLLSNLNAQRSTSPGPPVRVHKSMTTSQIGCEQQTRRLPSAGLSSGSGS